MGTDPEIPQPDLIYPSSFSSVDEIDDYLQIEDEVDLVTGNLIRPVPNTGAKKPRMESWVDKSGNLGRPCV